MVMHQYESVAELYEDLLSNKSLQNRKKNSGSVDSSTELLGNNNPPLVGAIEKYRIVSGLLFTTIISTCLLAGNFWSWTVSNDVYNTIIEHRATIQFAAQLVANILGAIHIGVIYLLINYSTRLRIATSKFSLELLHFWSILLSQKLDWNLPFHLIALLLLSLALCMLPPALWAGAITPVDVLAAHNGTLFIPSWGNTTIMHQNYTNRSGIPSRKTKDGLFAFNVGEAFIGALLSSAASATTVDGDVRRHVKQDLTGFTYLGRSYGVGSTVGISIPSSNMTSNLGLDSRTQTYSFLEPGYLPTATCTYNTTSAYSLSSTPYGNETMIWTASGLMPNSNGIEEYARYASYSSDAVVAVGVASSPSSTSGAQTMSIAAGKNYAFLNGTQCAIDFQPAMLEARIDLSGRTITVTPVASKSVVDMEPSGFLTWLATWQLSLISQDQGKIYSSALGDAFNSSIGNFITSAAANSTQLTLSKATLPGLENSIEAMIDDILTLYSSAQVIVASQDIPVTAIVHIKAFQLGEKGYIIAVVILNVTLIVAFVFEAVRTKSWKGLVDNDYTSTRDFVLGIARGVEDGTGSGLDTPDSVGDRDVARVTKPRRNSQGVEHAVYVRQKGEIFEILTCLEEGEEEEEKSKRMRWVWNWSWDWR